MKGLGRSVAFQVSPRNTSVAECDRRYGLCEAELAEGVEWSEAANVAQHIPNLLAR